MKKAVVLLLTFLFACSTENLDSLRTKSREALKEKNYSKAIEYAEEFLSREPQNADAHYILGQTYRMMIFSDAGMLQKINISYAEKSSEQFRKVLEISPEYHGFWFFDSIGIGPVNYGEPYDKILNNWQTIALTYLYQNKPDSAKWAFKQGQSEGILYPAVIEYAKNIMASCEKRAILFIDDSYSSFPMWFLQLVENYRTDITVVNLSLLNIHWYIKQLKNGYPFGENNLFISMTDAEIDNLKPKLWTVEIPVKHDPLNKEGKIDWQVRSTNQDMAASVPASVKDLMLIEILKSNDWNRPIYFTTIASYPSGMSYRSGWSWPKFFTNEGLVLKLNSNEAHTSVEKMYRNLTQVCTYSELDDTHFGRISEMILMHYGNALNTLAGEYLEAGNKEKNKEILDFREEKLPKRLFSIFR